MDTILIIGGRPHTVRKAKELGLRVVLMQHPEFYAPEVAGLADGILLADYTDWEVARPLALAAHEAWGFSRVVSLVDQAMPNVGRINDLLGLPGTSHTVSHRFFDKLAMRRRLAATGLEAVAAEPVEHPDELRAFGAAHGYPLVLKPVDGTGSRGVTVIEGPELIDEVWKRSEELRSTVVTGPARFYPVDRFVAEEYIDGPEYAVESFSFGGRHIVVGITEKLSAGVVEVGHAEPAAMAPDTEAALIGHITAFLDAMELRDGNACTEIKMSSRGPRIIESQDRVPGDRVMDLVEQVYGFDMERYSVGWPFGLLPELTERPPVRCGAATRFLSAEPGTVTAIDGLEETAAHPGVLDVALEVEVGDEVKSLEDNYDRIGQLLTTGPDAAAAVELCDRLLTSVTVTTTATSAPAPAED